LVRLTKSEKRKAMEAEQRRSTNSTSKERNGRRNRGEKKNTVREKKKARGRHRLGGKRKKKTGKAGKGWDRIKRSALNPRDKRKRSPGKTTLFGKKTSPSQNHLPMAGLMKKEKPLGREPASEKLSLKGAP